MFNLFRRTAPEQKAITNTGELARYMEWLNGGSDNSTGETVTESTALRVSTVYACWRVLAEDIAQLPLVLMRKRRDGRGADRATDHPLYGLLHDAPNEFQTSYEWREQGVLKLNSTGNVFYLKNQSGDRIAELLPLDSDRVEVARRADWTMAYSYRSEAGGTMPIDARDVLHIHGPSLDGFTGLSPLTYHRETIGLAMTTSKHGGRVFKNGLKVGKVITHPGVLKPETRKNLQASLQSGYTGDRAFMTMVLEEGMKLETPATITERDAQYLETRQFQRDEICAIHRVQPHMVMNLLRSTNNNIEHQGMEHVVYTLMPWVKRYEQRIDRHLLSDADRRAGYFSKFIVTGLMRGDASARSAFYSQAINAGWMTRNEARDLEDMNPLDGLDEPLAPVNLAPASASGDQP